MLSFMLVWKVRPGWWLTRPPVRTCILLVFRESGPRQIRGLSNLIITFVFESVKLLVEYAGIQHIVHLNHFFRMARNGELRGCGLHEAAQG